MSQPAQQQRRRFEGQVVLIAGGSKNLGRSLSIAFARQGALLSIFARSEEDLKETRKLCLEARGTEGEKENDKAVLISIGDVSIASDVERIVSSTLAHFGRISISINNACYDSHASELAEVDPAEFAKVMNVGVNGTFHCMKYVIQAMLREDATAASNDATAAAAASSTSSSIAAASSSTATSSTSQQRGIIINVASRYGHVAFPRWSAYSTAKHAVIGLTKTAAVEYARRGIRINAFSPGAIESGMIVKDMADDPTLAARLTSSIPMGRIAKEEEFIHAIFFLASPEASFFQGTALVMDGGFTAQ